MNPLFIENISDEYSCVEFSMKFEKETGLCLGDFKNMAMEVGGFMDSHSLIWWDYSGYRLEYSKYGQYYRLYKL